MASFPILFIAWAGKAISKMHVITPHQLNSRLSEKKGNWIVFPKASIAAKPVTWPKIVVAYLNDQGAPLQSQKQVSKMARQA